jgi:hypothetical protein
MAGNPLDLTGLVSVLQNMTQAINNNNKTFNAIFPISTNSIASTASAGTGTLPATPQSFLNVNINGTAYKVPLYLP